MNHTLKITIRILVLLIVGNVVFVNQGISQIVTETKPVVHATPVPEWAEMLRQKKGWIGADGIYSIPLNGIQKAGESDSIGTMFWFSDTMLGNIDQDSLTDGWDMIHNSVAYMPAGNPDPQKIKFYWSKDDKNENTSMFTPKTISSKKGQYYWLGSGFLNHATDSTIYIFAYRIKNVPGGVYPFQDLGVSLIALPKGSRPPFKDQRQMDTPLFFKDKKGRKVVFGISVLSNTEGARAVNPDGYIYVYGVRDPHKELIVSRVKEEKFENFSAWTYWDGTNWTKDANNCEALTSKVSNEMSVSFMDDGRVLAVYQYESNSPTVAVQVGKTPSGPFQPVKKIWETPEVNEDLDFYTYNAKAHVHLSKPGQLLISYNVNSFDFLHDIKEHPHHLRPRFISLKYK